MRILPLINGFLIENPGLSFMHDNASPHKAAHTRNELESRGITPIEWPPFSPDLNPIESVWNTMKDYIQTHYTGHRDESTLYTAIQEAWNAVETSLLDILIDSMPRRCEAVIQADGRHIGY
jgi:transposase